MILLKVFAFYMYRDFKDLHGIYLNIYMYIENEIFL